MRILVLIHEFPPIGGGGGRAAEGICQNLARRGHQVKVLTSHLKGTSYREERNGYQILRIPCLRTQPFRAGFISMLAYVLAGFWAGFRLIRAFHPDVIHVHFAVPAGALAWLLSLLTGIPYILTAHLGDVPGGVPEKTGGWFRWVLPFTRPIWKNAVMRVAVSEYTRGLALTHYNEEILVIPNGIDVQAWTPGTVQLNHPTVVVFAGRMVTQKAPLQVIRSLAEIKALTWKCVMLGDGPLMPEVKRKIDEHGLQDRFTLTGWITPEEVMKWFSKSDILFMPSLSEGLPVVGVQALAMGLAIVASRVGGFVDLVDEGRNGYLIHQKDAFRFSNALKELLLDPVSLSAFRRASLEKAKAFEIDRIADRYENLFLEAKAGGSEK